MKKNILSSIVFVVIVIMIAGCSDSNEVKPINIETSEVLAQLRDRDVKKWAEEKDLQKKQDEDDKAFNERVEKMYKKYISAVKKYKKTKHRIMFGWFNSWNPSAPDEYSQLDLLPDSMDLVSIWGGGFGLSNEKKAQLKSIQSKGTKVVLGWIIENVGDQIVWESEHWSNTPEEAIREYAQAICDSVNKYGYDGFDIDYEPSYASPFKPGNHCGDWSTPWTEHKAIMSCDMDNNKEYEILFFKTMREILGQDKILNINGSIHWLDPSAAQYFNYFTVQSYHNSPSGWTDMVLNRLSSVGVKKDRIIYTETFQNNKGNRDAFKRYADFVMNNLNGEAGGVGAFHINEDAFDNLDYKHVRNAIQIMNPAEE